MTTPEPANITVEDLLQAIPSLIGFTPADSLVLAFLTSDGGVAVIAVLSLSHDDEQLAGELNSVVAAARDARATRAILLGYGTEEPVGRALTIAVSALRTGQMNKYAAVRVTGDRYWPLTDPHHRGGEDGVAYQPSNSASAVSTVYFGTVTADERAALQASLAPVTGAARRRMSGATAEAQRLLEPMLAATADGSDPALAALLRHAVYYPGMELLYQVRQRYQDGQTADDGQVAALTVALTLPALRRNALRQTGGQPWEVVMWTDLIRRADQDYVAVPAALLAVCALSQGAQSLALIAIERALSVRPDDELTWQIVTALADGAEPGELAATLLGDIT